MNDSENPDLREENRLLRVALEQTKLDLARAGEQVEKLQDELQHQRMFAATAIGQVQEMRASKSWRITAPLRALSRKSHGAKQRKQDSGPTIVQSGRDQITVERGDETVLTTAEKVALVASWSKECTASKSVSVYLQELAKNGYATVLISTCEAPGKLQFPHGIPQQTIVLRRPNVGYDFGSWALALDRYPQVRQAAHVLITNDSMIGPFEPLQDLLRLTEEPGPDVTAATLSYQVSGHFQSFFVCFHNGILDAEPWRRFFDSIQEKSDKMSVVLSYELGMHDVCVKNGFSHKELFLPTDLNSGGGNPTLVSWSALVDKGFPFIKRTIYTDPSTAPGGESLKEFVHYRYNEDLEDWV
ncbi:rhamnan synthesis F family protein [Mobiluncus curtisii]|uniref:Glycosyl transferase n=1 Tax=Mobiluncus curtisii TaxID=2051 RepID=A0A7Y0UH95_9ACTO|nr:rhamnan synthesis F family protein [Mobiluncus curtisii]NMW87065.1 glycosyl transferase [Mobiluncus curtisii]